MTEQIAMCQCPDTTPCEFPATQEDFLCDRCRDAEHRNHAESVKKYLTNAHTGEWLYPELWEGAADGESGDLGQS